MADPEVEQVRAGAQAFPDTGEVWFSNMVGLGYSPVPGKRGLSLCSMSQGLIPCYAKS